MQSVEKAMGASRSRRPFTIPKTVASNFRIVGDLSRADEWRVKVLQGNSGTAKVGEWDGVGYIMISIDSHDIIPVARSDEHQTGYEVMRGIYWKKRLVPKENYVPVFAFGKNYVWGLYAKHQLEAFRRFRAYGGPNGIVQGANEHRRYIANMDDYIRGGGSVQVDDMALSPVGRYIVGRLELIAEGVVGKKSDVFAVAYDFIRWVGLNRFALMRVMEFGEGLAERLERDVLQAEAKGDFDLLADPFFCMNGIKNRLHNRIRKVVQGVENEFAKEEVQEFWGNLDVAMAEFTRLSQI